ncbi:type II secretion system minor pseudopilin GspH [Pseudomonas lundensis]|uniref:type II secretion system minor pseudopilin GspH n=1 Tax=Pseudomonas lundensis TaxID=86185 RepID=UPI001474D4DB|nr:type II secretion system minor pseudopilin GspH [Pseudomonas lundensis]NNA03727.1 type II secretion system minor pseudopilin GspH [Pseudomonas lundensis]
MRRAVAGFTLIEMMVVIVLIGVMASMVRISQGDNHARLARQEADVLLNLMHGLREKAVLEGLEFGLRLEPTAYQLMGFTQDQWQPLQPAVPLPDGP